MAHSGGPSQQQLPDAALRLLCQQRPASNISAATAPQASNNLPMALRPGALASNSFSMALRHGALAGQQLCLGAPASNKPHPSERSTPGLASNLAHLGRIC